MITPEEMRTMAYRMQAPTGRDLLDAAAMLRSIAAEREGEWWRLPQVQAKTTNNTGEE